MKGREGKEISFCGVRIDNLTMEEAVETVRKSLIEKKKQFVVYVNSDVVIRADRDGRLKEIINSADLVLADGMPVVWLSRLYPSPIRERVAGSDMVPRLCKVAWEEKKSVFLLGGQEGVPQAAAENLQKRFPGLRIAGWDSPPLGFEKRETELARLREKITASGAELLIVCLGCPKQERFIYENMAKYGATVSVCAGATIDFLAGRVKRCPVWMGRMGLEWFYRFLKEPGRLFKRYFRDDMRIFLLAFKYRLRKR